MKESRKVSLRHLFEDEGDSIRRDREKTTKWGITAAALSIFLIEAVDYERLETIDRETAEAFWLDQWDRKQLDLFPSGLDYFVLDCGCTCGFDVTFRWLSYNMCIDAGDQNAQHIAQQAYYRTPDQIKIILEAMAFQRRRRHKTLPGWYKYQEQWTNRVNRVKRRALVLAQTLDLGLASPPPTTALEVSVRA